MGAPFGVTSTGFNAATVTDCNDFLQADLQGAFGAGIDLSPQSNFGQLAGVIGERLADVYAMGQDVYNAGTPDGAAGSALDFVNGIRGVLRLGPESSTVLETLLGDGTSASLALHQVIAVAGIGTQFQTTIAATLPTASPTPWASSTLYAQGDVVDTGGISLWICVTGGTSGLAAPSGFEAAIPDGSAVWAYAGERVIAWYSGAGWTAADPATGKRGSRVSSAGNVWLCTTAGGGVSTVLPGGSGDGYAWLNLGPGSVAVDVPCASVLTGPQPAGAGSLNSPVTPVAHWTGAFNVLAAAIGQNLEQDDGGSPGPGYRLRAEQEIRAGGSTYVDAIRKAVLAALIALNEDNQAASVSVIENVADTPDAQGRPPHSFEVIVDPVSSPGGDPATNVAIATAILTNKPTGIGPCSQGGTTATVHLTDSQGNPHTVVFSLPLGVRTYASLTLHIDPNVLTDDGSATVAAAAVLSAFVAGSGAGRNLTSSALSAQCYGLNVSGQPPGVLDVTGPGSDPQLEMKTSGGFSAATLVFDVYHFPTLATSDVTIDVDHDDL